MQAALGIRLSLSTNEGTEVSVDEAIIQKILRRDPDGLAQLEATYREDVLRRLGRLTAWNDEVEDLWQEVLLLAWRRAGSIDPPEGLRPWLLVVATNHCRSWQRRKQIFKRVLSALRLQSEGELCAENPGENSMVVRDALSRLRITDREILVLRYLEHMDIGEIAELLGMKRHQVDVRLSRARKRLGDILEAANE